MEFEIELNDDTEAGDVLDHINEVLNSYVNRLCREVRVSDMGLDFRAGHTVYVPPGDNYIIIDSHRAGQLEYYGGFEYVDKECVCRVGDYVFYSDDDSRVAEHLSILIARESGEDAEDEPDDEV